ncbi:MULTISPECIES: GntR family transcriptional regulator [Pantoea]|uniref:GntR family transcriptional regulator n=1 Tax=Candidatus Pantoea multigeneris TaxID=2608357 RepID=A0ABX0R4K3_9GAMM|nr:MULTISPECIES: GntR family transcriptional regulator [Pantoea]NIF20007.1 GntR family transcriptional regulator [Pantoea multigeneris]
MIKKEKENPTQKETGAVRVYGVLRDEILTMKLAPGSAIDEVSLAERFTLSRSPIREALVRLSADGLVTMLPNRSTVVSPMNFSQIPEFLDALDLVQRVITRLAAMHRTEAQLIAIRKAEVAYEKALKICVKNGNSQGMIEKNYDYHMAIAEAAHNSYFTDVYRRLLEEGRRMLHLHFQFQTLDEHKTADQIGSDHSLITNAIEARDVELAEKYAHQHAAQFRGRFMQFLNRNLTSDVQINYP